MQIKNYSLNRESMKQLIKRLGFVFLLTVVAVFFSEKAYWYPTGFAIFELWIFYSVPIFACLWAIDYFKVNNFPTLILIASLYAFLVEGVITPVIFEGGLFDPIMPAYFIGWHGILAIVLGWFWFRKWLIDTQPIRLIGGAVGFGLLWGAWSISYWLPEYQVEYADSIGPLGSVGPFWQVEEFGMYAFFFTGIMILSHLLLGLGGWQSLFKPSKFERWIIVILLLFFFGTLSFPGAPFGILKLAVMLTAVFIPLYQHRKRSRDETLLQQLDQPIYKSRLWYLFLMPLVATAVYALALPIQGDYETLLFVSELVTLFQAALGAGLFIWALFKTIAPSKTIEVVELVN